MHSLQAQTGYNCTRKFGFKKGRASKRSKVLDIYIVDLQSIDHWISYLVRNPCRFFTVMYKRLRLECFHFAVNEQGNLTPFWKTLFAYLALGSRMWGAHKLPLIRQDQHSITLMPLKFYSAISKPSFARVCETRNSSFNSSHSFGFASQKASLIVLRHIRNQLRSKPSV